MYQVEVEDSFSAAHFLKLYDGSFELRHGHDWKVKIVMQSKGLDSMGVVIDFEALKPIVKATLADLHERCINDHPHFANQKVNPSTENIAKFIFDTLNKKIKSKNAKVVKVTVWETPDASASCLG